MARCCSASAATIAFSWRWASPTVAVTAAGAAAIAVSNAAISSLQHGQRVAAASTTASRRSLISRLVARMPRASVRLPPLTTWAPR